MSARILIVDPAQEALDAYCKSLASKASSWTLVLARTAEEAFEKATAQPPDIAVAALTLDNGQGLKVLSKIVDIAPLAHAFIVAEESEKANLAAALEGGCRYLPSPCPTDRLLLEFQRCLAIDSWLESPVVKEIFARRSDFETLPPLYLKVASAINSSYASTASIAEAISGDLAVSAKILETVNSTFYGFDQQIGDIAHAISVLGFTSVKNIVLAINVFDQAGSSPEHKALVNELWHHSAAVAVAARRICLHETKDANAAEEAYSAGLLHDVGKLVLLNAVGEQYIEAQRVSRDESIAPWQAEIRTIGCDHAEAGAYLLARWGLPEALCEAAALHHRPANSCRDGFSALAAVHAANAIVRKRKNSNHIDAAPTLEYLDEIGKAEQWLDWEAVAIGNPPPSQSKRALRTRRASPVESPQASPVPAHEPDLTSVAAHAALARAVELAAVRREERERIQNSVLPRKNVLYAFAAGIAVSLFCIYFISTLGESDEKGETAERAHADAKIVATDESDASGDEDAINSRSRVLEVLFEAQDKSASVADQATAAPVPEALKPVPFPEIELGAIFLRSSGAKAQVNGRIVGEGDSVEGAKIVRIQDASIVVEHDGRSRTISLD